MGQDWAMMVSLPMVAPLFFCDDYQEYLNANDASQALFRPGANDAPIPKLAYARSSVFNQEHGKTRYGLSFEFKPDTPWFKQAKLNLHQQNIQIINHDIKKNRAANILRWI